MYIEISGARTRTCICVCIYVPLADGHALRRSLRRVGRRNRGVVCSDHALREDVYVYVERDACLCIYVPLPR